MKNYSIYKIFLGILLLALILPSLVIASTNIVNKPASARWAWNDAIGWINFYITDTVTVLPLGLQGYASSFAGSISLDCATSSAGNTCSGSNYQVLNDGGGNLSGWAWNDAIGWISFCGGQGTAACPGSVSYRVLINGSGDFSGWAWNDLVGWISFNCLDPGICGTSSYKVQTGWVSTSTSGYLDSSVFDTAILGGAQINSVVWQGSLPSPSNNAGVGFQFASATTTAGPWNYIGPDGTSNTYYTPIAPGVAMKVDYLLHNNRRYFRYRITLVSNQTGTASPRVDDVGINWSR